MNHSDERSSRAPSNPQAIKPLSLKANTLWNSAGSLTYLFCQWLTTVFVVKLTEGFDAAGLLSLAMAVVGIFSTFANYKMNTYQISDIKHEHTVGEYLSFRGLTLGLAFVACMIYCLFTCPLDALLTVALYFIYKAVGMVIDVLHAVDQQWRRMDYIGISFMLQGVTMLAAFILVFGFTQSLDGALCVMTVTAIAVYFLYDRPHASRFETIRPSLTKSTAWFFLKTSFPAVIASVAASAIFTIPKQYLLAVSGDAALGIYASISAPALIIQMSAVYLYTPLLDVYPRHFFKGDRRGFIALLVRTSLFILAAAAIFAVILEFIGVWLLTLLFGEEIVPYVYLLQPVIVATMMTAYLWFFGDLLITIRDFKGYFIGNAVAFVAVIPLSVLCVDQWDMNGVSFAGIIACALGCVVLIGFLVHDMVACGRGAAPLADADAAAERYDAVLDEEAREVAEEPIGVRGLGSAPYDAFEAPSSDAAERDSGVSIDEERARR